MKKGLFVLLLIHSFWTGKAQFEYHLTGKNDVPVLGMQWGITGGGFTAMLTNPDDQKADGRLDPAMVNFSYGGGVEGIYWFQPTFGFGAQALYWKAGASYVGKDPITNISLSARTDLTYIKIPFLMHFKSFNRYEPNRRFRFSAFVGPYVGLLNDYNDKVTYKDAGNKDISTVTLTKGDYNSNTLGTITNGTISENIYKPLDLGMVAGFGFEIRLWRRTVLTLHLRSDVGVSNVENNKKLKIRYSSNNTQEVDFSPWANLYAKYNSPNALDILSGFRPNRPATKNLGIGGFISLRKYVNKQ